MKSAHTCGLYENSLHGGESGIYATTGEAAIRLFTLILRICRFSGGSKLNRSPRCCHSLRNDGAKINNLLGICNIVSRFFHFGGKISAKRPFLQVLFCPFQRKWKKSLYLAPLSRLYGESGRMARGNWERVPFSVG